MVPDLLDIDPATHQGSQVRVFCRLAEGIHSLVPQIPNPRSKSEAQQVAHSKNMIRISGSVRVMLLNLQLRFVIEKAVNHMRGVPGGDERLAYFRIQAYLLIDHLPIPLELFLVGVFPAVK